MNLQGCFNTPLEHSPEQPWPRGYFLGIPRLPTPISSSKQVASQRQINHDPRLDTSLINYSFNVKVSCSWNKHRHSLFIPLMLQIPCEDVFRHPFNPLQKPSAQGIGPIMVYLLQHGYATKFLSTNQQGGPRAVSRSRINGVKWWDPYKWPKINWFSWTQIYLNKWRNPSVGSNL